MGGTVAVAAGPGERRVGLRGGGREKKLGGKVVLRGSKDVQIVIRGSRILIAGESEGEKGGSKKKRVRGDPLFWGKANPLNNRGAVTQKGGDRQ